MKKLLLISTLVVSGCMQAFAAPDAFQVTDYETFLQTGGMMCLGMSDNGRYIVGSTASWEGFLYDCQEKRMITTGEIPASKEDTGAKQFYAVSDDGVAYGFDGNGAVCFNIDGDYKILQPIGDGEEYEDAVPKGVTADGSIVVGFVTQNFVNYLPCYWQNGEIHILDYSTAAEAGFPLYGASALSVSADGSVIMGSINSRSKLDPFVYWIRQTDGSYKYVPAFEGNYEDARKTDGTEKSEDDYNTDLLRVFKPSVMSRNGKTVVLEIQKPGDVYNTPWEVALYDISTGEISVIDYDPTSILYEDPNNLFYITGISDNGYLIGFSGYPAAGDNTPFILYPGEYDKPKMLTEAFPGVELLEQYEDFCFEWHPLYMLTCMSADGSAIAGYIEVFFNEAERLGGMATFYIETGFEDQNESTGVGSLIDNTVSQPVEYYTVDGLRTSVPRKGLNIVRYPDGSTSKVIL